MGEYVFRWGKTKMCPTDYPLAKYKGQCCAVLARGKMNSCLVEFDDGYKAVVSRNAIRRTKCEN